MKILIFSFLTDSHALNVKWALEKLGHECDIGYSNAFVDHHRVSLNATSASFSISLTNLKAPLEDYDIVWFRRYASTTLPSDVHEGDAIPIALEWKVFERSLRYLLTLEKAFVVNPPSEAFFAGLKPVQLKIATESGFSIPDTLISNNPEEISAFLSSGERTIYKTFVGPGWVEGGRTLDFLNTEIVSLSGFEEASVLTPGIYQRYVPKAYEVRLIVMGRTLFAVRIDSQSDATSEFDWRQRPQYTQGIVDIIVVPEHIRQRVHRFLDRCDIIFGSFDFIVTTGGEWVFLEINTGGQFLWLERDIPGFPLLDAFCSFLVSRSKTFVYEPAEPKVRIHEFENRFRAADYHEPGTVPLYRHPYVVEDK